MILEVQHETRLEYTEPVTEWMTEVRMEPLSEGGQTCQSFHLKLSQPASLFRYRDGFGNGVHHFNLLAPHKEVRILAAALVETTAASAEPREGATWPLRPDQLTLEALDYLQLRGPTAPTPLLEPLLEALRPSDGQPVGVLATNTANYIKEHFQYAPDATNASSPIRDVLQQGKGVCQDFAHLMIAVLRSFGVPTRYVSGYIHRPSKDSQSHAWVEVWRGDGNWLGVDPTNNCVVNDHFVKVAVGRDFTDVPPNRGIYRGRGEENIFVRVETRRLERMPSLSWQEQLPPLNVPLTALRTRPRANGLGEEEAQQQQQQQ
jgi:transglutaminase-like putative cysteine protease